MMGLYYLLNALKINLKIANLNVVQKRLQSNK